MRFLSFNQFILLLEFILDLRVMVLGLHDIKSEQGLLVHLAILIFLELLNLFYVFQSGVLL